MGEYVNYKNDSVKIGTCESLYYTRYEQMKSLLPHLSCDGSISPADYTKNDSGFRFRFPFPDEDSIPFGEFKDFERGVMVTLDENTKDFAIDLDHRQMCTNIKPRYQPKSNIHTFNLFTPCPQSKDFNLKTSTNFPHYGIEIVQQKPTNNELWVVIRCPYCGTMARIDKEDALRLVNYIKSAYQDDQNMIEIANRIEQGYK